MDSRESMLIFCDLRAIFREINWIMYVTLLLSSRNSFSHSVSHKKIFRETNLLYSMKALVSRNFCEKSLTVISCDSQCGNYGNSLSRIFRKNFVKVTVLLNRLLKSWFDEIFLWWERISRSSTLCDFHDHNIVEHFARVKKLRQIILTWKYWL